MMLKSLSVYILLYFTALQVNSTASISLQVSVQASLSSLNWLYFVKQHFRSEAVIPSDNILHYFKSIWPTYFKRNPRFSDVSVELQLIICEQLEFYDLLNIAQVNNHFASLAADVFRRQFGSISIECLINDQTKANRVTALFEKLGFLPKTDVQYASVVDGEIQIFEMKMVLNALERFGHVLKKLTISYIEPDRMHPQRHMYEISKAINMYCQRSLNELHVRRNQFSVLAYMTRPFERVDRLNLDVNESIEATLPMNQLFPALRYLSLNVYSDNSYINCHFAHLDHLTVRMDNGSIDGMLLANPHIQSVTVHMLRLERLKLISDSLPGIKNLTICGMSDNFVETNQIYFGNVTNFTFSCVANSISMLESFTFPRLEAIHMSLQHGQGLEQWIRFFGAHKHLTQITMKYFSSADTQFEKLTSHLINVKQMGISRSSKRFPSQDAIIKFLQRSEQLIKLQVDSCSDYDLRIFSAKVHGIWKMRRIGTCVFSKLNHI